MSSFAIASCFQKVNFQDQVYSNTRVPTQINTNQHEFDTNQHELDTNQHDSTRVTTSLTQINMSPTRINTSQHESDTNQYELT